MNESNTDHQEKETEVEEFPVSLEKAIDQLTQQTDLDQLAKETGALIRHRGIQAGRGLLRLVLGYGILDYSLRLLGAWASLLQITQISKTALLRRLQKCTLWLGKLIVIAMEQQKLNLPTGAPLRIKLLDASVVCQPGSRGTDWRLHLGFDLSTGCMDQVEITNGRGAELASRFQCGPGEAWIGDRAYALARSLAHLVFSGAWLVIRTGWNRIAWEQEDGRPFDLIGWLKKANLGPQDPGQETQVWISWAGRRFSLRLIAKALPEVAAERAQRHCRQESKKNHHTPDERSLFSAGFILLLTNLPAHQYPLQYVLDLYRFRWQVELAFKRFKSLIHLDHLRAKDADLAQVYLFSKILGIILMERIQLELIARYPQAFHSRERPISLWRLSALLWEDLRNLVRGPVTLQKILEQFPSLLKYLCDEPRSRVQQLAYARCLMAGLCG